MSKWNCARCTKPEQDEMVLCFIPLLPGGESFQICFRDGERWRFNDGGYVDGPEDEHGISHWMPLPEAPKP